MFARGLGDMKNSWLARRRLGGRVASWLGGRFACGLNGRVARRLGGRNRGRFACGLNGRVSIFHFFSFLGYIHRNIFYSFVIVSTKCE